MSVNDISSDEEQFDSKGKRKEEEMEEMEEEEFVEGSSHFSNFNKILKEDSMTQSLDPRAMEEDNAKTVDKVDAYSMLFERMDKLKSKFVGLTRFSVKMIHNIHNPAIIFTRIIIN